MKGESGEVKNNFLHSSKGGRALEENRFLM